MKIRYIFYHDNRFIVKYFTISEIENGAALEFFDEHGVRTMDIISRDLFVTWDKNGNEIYINSKATMTHTGYDRFIESIAWIRQNDGKFVFIDKDGNSCQVINPPFGVEYEVDNSES